MKIAVIKLGSRIAVGSKGTSGGTGEVLSVIKLLTTAGAEVTAYTKVLAKDTTPTTFKVKDIISEYDDIANNDILVVLNGNVNYFGGADDPHQTTNYKVINNFKGKVFYVLCDINLVLKQIWNSVEKKPWADNYKREDIEITRKDIVYISQPRNTKFVLDKARKQGIEIADAKHFPFEKFPLVTMKRPLAFNYMPSYDLLYGGTFRNGKREDDMVKFYFGYPDDVNVEMFGNIKVDNFNKKKVGTYRAPSFGPSVSYTDFPTKMNDAKATVIIGDKEYKKADDLAQRIYECILSKNIVFIDETYDFNKRVYKDEELRKFCYVANRRQVAERLAGLSEEDRERLVNKQIEDTKIDISEYCRNFLDLLK